MKNVSFIKYILTLSVFMITCSLAIAQQSVTTETAHQWVKKGIWKNGLKLKLHPVTNEAEFAAQYTTNKAAWDKAIDFLRDRNLDLILPGKYPIDGDIVFATITEGPAKELEQTAWESHKNYIDLQYVIKGKEKIGIFPADSSLITEPYDAAKDATHYKTDGKFFTATPDTFFLFFPGDAHRPGIKAGNNNDDVKKLVIKIKIVKQL